MKTSRVFGLLSSGVVVGTSLLAAGCSPPDDIEAEGSRQNLDAKDVKTLFACEQLTGDGKGLSVGWSKKDKAITFRDSVYDLKSVDFYPDNVSPNSGGPAAGDFGSGCRTASIRRRRGPSSSSGSPWTRWSRG